MPDLPPVLTVAVVAELKGVTKQAVHEYVQRGKLTSYRSGRTVLIRCDKKLEAYLGMRSRTAND